MPAFLQLFLLTGSEQKSFFESFGNREVFRRRIGLFVAWMMRGRRVMQETLPRVISSPIRSLHQIENSGDSCRAYSIANSSCIHVPPVVPRFVITCSPIEADLPSWTSSYLNLLVDALCSHSAGFPRNI
ncbi:hypothetical protein SFC43_13410 [Bacteroides sp. CR5/BHMF/2]|nr:hypothetical protein [Bacteroides sp. CR5/BHMF/2]